VPFSFIRQALIVCRSKNKAFTRRRRGSKTSLSTRQWLVLTFGIAALVGVVFILTLYYQPGR